MQVELKQINTILDSMFKDKLIVMTISQSSNWGDEKSQGDTGLEVTIYSTPLPNIFLKVEREEDSYGRESSITKIEFVTPITKTVTDYQSI